MSLRDDNKVKYNYNEYLNENDWVSHSTATINNKLSLNEKLLNLTKAVEKLQKRIEILESIEEKKYDEQ